MNERAHFGLALLGASIVVFFAMLKYGVWAFLLGAAMVVAGFIFMATDDSSGPYKSREKPPSQDPGAGAYASGILPAHSKTPDSQPDHHSNHIGDAGDGSGD
jgi:hypothetical protein